MKQIISFDTKYGRVSGAIEVITRTIPAHSFFSRKDKWDLFIKRIKEAIDEVSKMPEYDD